jgi:hypothetical protein
MKVKLCQALNTKTDCRNAVGFFMSDSLLVTIKEVKLADCEISFIFKKRDKRLLSSLLKILVKKT